MTIGEYIKSLRKANKMTLKVLEKKSGVSNSYLSQIENNKFNPTPEILRRISNGLEINYNHLLEKAGYLENSNEIDWLSTSILHSFLEIIAEKEGRNISDIPNVNFMDLYTGENGDIFSESPKLATLTRAIIHHYAKIAELGEIATLFLKAHGKYKDAIEKSGYDKTEFAVKMMVQEFSNYDVEFMKKISEVFGRDIISAAHDLKRIVSHEWKNEIKSLKESRDIEPVTVFVSTKVQNENDEWIYMSPDDAYHNMHELEKAIFMINGLTVNGVKLSQKDKQKAVKLLKLMFE